MRIPRTLTITPESVPAHCTYDLICSTGGKYYVWGGHFTTGDKISWSEKGHTKIENIHVTAPIASSQEFSLSDSIKVKKFHVTFEFAQKNGGTTSPSVRYNFKEYAGAATPQMPDSTLATLSEPQPMLRKMLFDTGGKLCFEVPGIGIRPSTPGKNLGWDRQVLKDAAADIARQVYESCLY